MKLDDEIRIEVTREVVFTALNDADILRRSIPGCEELEKVSSTQFNALVRAKVGPVRARFRGEVTLSDLNPPESYTLSGQGKGGAAGFARGEASVQLTADGDATILKYNVSASVGGKLAQLGGRLIDNAAKKLAAEFFKNFQEVVGGADSGEAEREAS
jgi:carbon monoxide dehydrogenase subunit G